MPRSLTIVTQWYPPEHAPFGHMMHELAQHLALRGWDVTVITGFPNHPSGIIFGGYRRRWLLEEQIDGVRVCRVWLATSPQRSMLNRLATFVSFTLTASLRLLHKAGPDIVFAPLQPLSLGLILPLIVRMRRARLVLNLQDLHPDTQIRLGMVKSATMIRLLRRAERYAYQHCHGLTAISEAFRTHAIERGAPPNRTAVIPNWVDTSRISPSPALGEQFRVECGLTPDQFVVLWAGTLGLVSGIMLLAEVAQLLRDEPRIRFLVVGEGPLRAKLAARIEELALTNITLLPFQSEEKLVAVQNAGDVSLVTLGAGFADTSVPSKVLAYMAAGRAVVAATPRMSETARLIQAASAGIVVDSTDSSDLAAAIRELSMNRARTRSLGEAGRDYVVRWLSRDSALGAYERFFLDSVASK